MISYWEQSACYYADYIIIGAGIIGLSSAIELKIRKPQSRVVVLERGLFGEGASTKNAGFAGFGSLSEIAADIDRMGRDAALSIVERRWRGLAVLRNRLGDDAMDFEPNGGYELLFENDCDASIGRLDEINAAIADIFQQTIFIERPNQISSFGFEKVRGLIFNPLEGQINSGKMMMALRAWAARKGVEILTGVNVLGVREENSSVVADIVANGENIAFKAIGAAVCTNAFIPKLAPNFAIYPGRGQVVITDSMPALPFKGAFHFNKGYYYFRNVGQRILFGGGRNLDFSQETTHTFGVTDNIRTSLETYLKEVIAPGSNVRVMSSWSGIMGFSPNKLPIVGCSSPRIVIGFGCNGIGVSLGSNIGGDVASLLSVVE